MSENLTDKEIKAAYAREWRLRRQDHSRSYMRLYMRKRRAAQKASKSVNNPTA